MKVFVSDVEKCLGCYCCQISCKDEYCGNDWMPYSKPQPMTGQFWRKVEEHVRGTVPKVKVAYIPTGCMHCDDAPCINACTDNAIYKREDGMVIIDPQKCTGQQLCIDACPYGAIYFNNTLNIAKKCTGCAHLLDRGWPIKEPRCVDPVWREH
jgi:Fe-S-cluster-containing dehydrogenase component